MGDDFQFEQLDKYNPYNQESDTESISIGLHLQQKACNVKIIIILDFVSNIFYGIYGFCLYILFASATLCGFYSTFTYNSSFLLLYLIYQLILLFFKVCNAILFTALASSDSLQDWFNNHTIVNDTNSIDFDALEYQYIVPYSWALVIIQFIIIYFIVDFYRILPSNIQSQRLRLGS